MKNKLLFLINPISGVGDQSRIHELIKDYVSKDRYTIDIKYTLYAGHGRELAMNAVKEKFNAVIVAGGDGSVNETASALSNTSLALGIIPNGSGNGLARHLKIPLNPVESIHRINKFKSITIDTFSINGQFACNLAGIGFDALVAHEFAKVKIRGLLSYLKLIFKLYASYQPVFYKIIYNNTEYVTKPLLLAIANSNQFGNGAQIAPQANISDGYLDVCLLEKVSLLKAPLLGFTMITGKINRLKIMKYFKLKEFIIENPSLSKVHIDGDPILTSAYFSVKINPLSLNVLI